MEKIIKIERIDGRFVGVMPLGNWEGCDASVRGWWSGMCH